MLPDIYPITFIISLAALTGWFFYKENPARSHFLRLLFFFGLASYAGTLLSAEATLPYKMGVLGRDLLVMAIVPVFLSLFRQNKIVYFALLFTVLGVLKFFYFEKLQNTFPRTQPANAEILLYNKGELLVEIRDNHVIGEVKSVLEKYNLQAEPAFFPSDKDATDLDDYFLVDVPEKEMIHLQAIKTDLMETGLVDWVEDNEQYTLSPLELEPQTLRVGPDQKKYGLNDPGLEHLWGFEEMKVANLYDFQQKLKPRKKALIAILDTGVDASHEDLKDNFRSVKGKYDKDRAGHGTHCAGIAGAVSNNRKGVASFSRENNFTQITSIKVLSDGGFGTQKMIIDGMLEAADAGADVLSLSLGGLSSDSKQRAYRKAVDYARKKGAIIVVAAGNSNRNAKEFAPANTPGVIAVSAVDTLLQRASFSNIVKDIPMGVAAPGVKIYSTFPGNQYQTFNGTSMATPYVAGLLGLMKSIKPELTTEEAYQILKDTGVPTKNTDETGFLIQPEAALKKLTANS